MRTRIFYLSQLPLVLLATAVVVALPIATLGAAQLALDVTLNRVLIALLASLLSMAFGWAGSRLWLRNPRSKDLLFRDLMLWGWVQRLIQERQLYNSRRALRFEASRQSRRDTKSAEKQIATLKRLAVRLEAQDPYTHGHTKRVARHSYMIAKAMGLPRDFAKNVRTAAAVHDVGKMDIPLEILHKPGRLTDEEFDMIKQHSVIGAEMVSAAGIDELTAMVRHHHERIDGRGYPDRLSGDEIPLGARIIAVADTFDAITSVRSYRDAGAHKKAVDIIRKESGKQLDPQATAAFLRYYGGTKSRRFAALVSSAPDKVIAWLGGLLHQAATAAAVTAAGVAVIAGPTTLPSPEPHSEHSRKVVTSVGNADVFSYLDFGAATDRGGEVARKDADRSSKDGTGDGGAGSGSGPDDDAGSGSGGDGSGGSGGGGSGGSGGSGDPDPEDPEDPDDPDDPVGDAVEDAVESVDETVEVIDDAADGIIEATDDVVGGLGS